MSIKRRLLALVLSILFGVYSTPKELLHVFQTHSDTEHHVGDGLRIESAHHHCYLLKADQALHLIEPPTCITIPEPTTVYYSALFPLSLVAKPLQGSCYVKKSRGPPVKLYSI
jgi:hypothetical protein